MRCKAIKTWKSSASRSFSVHAKRRLLTEPSPHVKTLGGVGGPAGPLTVFVSRGSATIGHHRTQCPALATCGDYTNRSHSSCFSTTSTQGGGVFDLVENIPYTKERPSGLFTAPTVTKCKKSGKRQRHFPESFYPLTAPATMPLMMCLLNMKYSTTMGDMVSSMAAICLG